MQIPITSYAKSTTILTEWEIKEMYALFDRYYKYTTFEHFLQDLENKNWIVILKNREKTIVGFSTLAFYSTELNGQIYGVVYSGDTIIEKSYWGTSELPRQWIKTVLEVGKDYPSPMYWLLISSGYKTYRFLTIFFKEFYPHCGAVTPAWAQELIEHLAMERFGQEYIKEEGVVRFSTNATPLIEGIADLNSRRLKDEHIRFFLEKNPGHAQGDELVCLTLLHPDNFTAAGKRMIR